MVSMVAKVRGRRRCGRGNIQRGRLEGPLRIGARAQLAVAGEVGRATVEPQKSSLDGLRPRLQARRPTPLVSVAARLGVGWGLRLLPIIPRSPPRTPKEHRRCHASAYGGSHALGRRPDYLRGGVACDGPACARKASRTPGQHTPPHTQLRRCLQRAALKRRLQFRSGRLAELFRMHDDLTFSGMFAGQF